MTEEWRPIPGYEGRYDVSSDGLIRSYTRWSSPREVSAVVTSGYRRVRLSDAEGCKATHGVHRLVLMAFDRLPVGDEQARHLNDNKLDNRIGNLAWGSQADNWDDRKRNGIDPLSTRDSCRHGHPYDDQNTAWITTKAGDSYRACRTCRAAASLRHFRKQPKAECPECGRGITRSYLPVHLANMHGEAA